ncbi:MAG: TlpA family protein disulfide reductase [Bacteroidales bacterium]|nr:TlpA family protein disulfide reductase [Bacteroidales bacterium]
MRNILLTVVVILIIHPQSINAQKVERIGIPELEAILTSNDDRLYVVNFWATWCAPCVKELPYFEKVAPEYKPEDVRFILVSLDFPQQIDRQLLPFLRKNRITLEVKAMTDLDYDAWIRKVDRDWQGNIPATLLFNNKANKRLFIPREVDEKDLREAIDKFL